MARKKEREAVVFLNEHMRLVATVLSDWERGKLFEQLRAYAMEGTLPDLSCESTTYQGIFEMMRAAQDRAIGKYEEVCERNKERIAKRWNAQNAVKDADQEVPPASNGIPKKSEDTNIIESNQLESKQIDSNLIKTKLIKNNLIKNNLIKSKEDTLPSLKGQEIEGVPGVVWG